MGFTTLKEAWWIVFPKLDHNKVLPKGVLIALTIQLNMHFISITASIEMHVQNKTLNGVTLLFNTHCSKSSSWFSCIVSALHMCHMGIAMNAIA